MKLRALGPKTLTALGVCLCFLMASFLCGFQNACDSVEPCHFWAPEQGTYQFIYSSFGTTNFTSVSVESLGGPTNVGPTHGGVPPCDKLVSFRKVS